MNLINVEALSVSFEGREVFKNLDFSVEEGDYLCILGENGSGKTTLMNCILGCDIKYSGEIECNGFLRKNIGWLPQHSETKSDFPASVSEVVMSGFSAKSFLGLTYSAEQRRTAQSNMELLDLSGLKNRSFKELSGGQQQRVLLCRALCAAERVLLLDEPVTGLDSLSQNELYTLISRLHKNGMTIIMISHDVDRAVCEARHILHIGHGGNFYGSVEDYLKTDFYSRIKEDRV